MPFAAARRRRWKWLVLAVPVAALAIIFGGAFVYIHFIAPDPAPKLSFSSVAPGGSVASEAGDPSATAPGAIDGTWTIASGSKVQYRVHETLSGQDNEATGSTAAVTGTATLAGTTVRTASFSVDMTTFSSDERQRDNQFRNRIMNTSRFPTATFELTTPIELTAIPDNLTEVAVTASGNLTLHGTTKAITFELRARRNGAHLEANGTIPITFSDYDINDPSGGPAQVGDQGDLEFLLILQK